MLYTDLYGCQRGTVSMPLNQHYIQLSTPANAHSRQNFTLVNFWKILLLFRDSTKSKMNCQRGQSQICGKIAGAVCEPIEVSKNFIFSK